MTHTISSERLADAANNAAAAFERMMLIFVASLDAEDQQAIHHVLQNGMRLGVLYVPNGPNADPLVRMVMMDAAGVAAPLADMAFLKDTLQ